MKDTLLSDTIFKVNDSLTIILNANSESSSQIISNLITILLALIAAFIALYQVKSNVISSARINWIESLRCAISEYSAEVNKCLVILINLNHYYSKAPTKAEKEKINDEYYAEYIISANKIDVLKNKLQLHLNSDENDHAEIEKHLEIIDNNLNKKDIKELKSDEIENNLKELVKYSKLIFKSEWKKAKKFFTI